MGRYHRISLRTEIRARLDLEALESRELLTAPLPDLGPGLYKGFVGGLYPAGQNTRPATHEAYGVDLAQNQVAPLDAAGNVDLANGKIVMISVGMSNTTQEFGSGGPNSFKPRADADPSKNPQLVIVDGAQGGKPASAWIDPNASTWSVLDQRLTNAGVAPLQVQVAWVKQADAQPNQYGQFPGHARHLKDELADIARNLRINYPNIQIAYYSSRTMSYETNPNALNPEPFAFESGFSTKWLIGDQLGGDPNLNFDPDQGPAVAPYLSWGPYLWADGASPRSDGLVWLLSDLEGDKTHPSVNGEKKVADQLLAFFRTDPTATPWFLRSTVVGQAPGVRAVALPNFGTAPLTVNFKGNARDPDGTIVSYMWTFDDGTFSSQKNPTKIFPAPGEYEAHVTATDNDGNAVTRTVVVDVSAGRDSRPSLTRRASGVGELANETQPIQSELSAVRPPLEGESVGSEVLTHQDITLISPRTVARDARGVDAWVVLFTPVLQS